MSVKKTVTPPKPKRFEIGYEFLVKAKIVGIDEAWERSNEGDWVTGYEIEFLGACLDYQTVNPDELIALESTANPKVKKEVLQSKLKEEEAKLKAQQEVIAQLKKQITETN